MQELEFGARKYRTGKLTTFQQFHLVRKLLPLFSGMGEGFGAMTPIPSANGEGAFWQSLHPVAQAIADMSVEDSEWIVKTCIATCQAFNGRSWVPVATPQGDLMFDDIDLQALLQLSFAVVQDNLGSFFPVSQTNGLADEGPALATSSG